MADQPSTAALKRKHEGDEGSSTEAKGTMILQRGVVVGTWSFAREAVRSAGHLLGEGHGICEALVGGVKVIEEDPATGPYFVGVGGHPNNQGVIELDAAVMRGRDCHVAAVAGMHGISSPASVALAMLKEGDAKGHFHSLLVGQGAQAFATSKGFPVADLSTPESMQAYANFVQERAQKAAVAHDTLSLVGVDACGNAGACVSTSGMAFKHAGRVGDSPLPGAGYYADSLVGAAAASGEGDKIMRFAPSLQVVQEMSKGLSPQEACQEVLRRIEARVLHSGERMFEMVLIAVSKDGGVGAGSTFDCWTDHVTGEEFPGFPFVVGQIVDGKLDLEMLVQGRAGEPRLRDERQADVFPKCS